MLGEPLPERGGREAAGVSQHRPGSIMGPIYTFAMVAPALALVPKRLFLAIPRASNTACSAVDLGHLAPGPSLAKSQTLLWMKPSHKCSYCHTGSQGTGKGTRGGAEELCDNGEEEPSIHPCVPAGLGGSWWHLYHQRDHRRLPTVGLQTQAPSSGLSTAGAPLPIGPSG